jgi:hypothetical protein
VIKKMAKKSRKTAARFSELSKASKKKRRNKSPVATATIAAPVTQEQAEPTPLEKPVPKPAPRTKPALKRAALGYQYVRDDLKKISMLAGIMIVILIVLAFILG